VELLADTEGEACRSYGVLQEKEMEGKRKTGIQRSTFVIDRDGVVRHALYGVTPRGHAAEVLNLLRGMS
jgi:peroxiredoxin